MLSLKYDPVHGLDYSYLDRYRYTPDYRTRRPIEYYFNWPWKYRYWFTNHRFRRNLYKELRMLKARYNAVYGNEYYLADTRSIPDYRIHRSYNFYDFWPYVVKITYRNRPFRRWLTSPTYMIEFENRYDPIFGYDYTHWPDSKYFRNYRFSPPISITDPWSYRSRVWFPYYWSTRRLFQHYIDYKPSDMAIRDVRRMIYINYPYRTIDYYPESTRIYRPLTCYYNYYYPIRSLNYYSDVWPYYPYYRYLYYKYTLPSDRYYHLKGRIVYLPSSVADSSYRFYPTAPYIRNKIYKPLSLYCDYYEPIRSLYWNSSYWPLYRSVSSFVDDLPSEKGRRLQKIFDNETSLIRAQTSALLRQIHDPVPRVQRLSWPLATVSRHYNDVLPSRYSSDNYIHKMLTTSPVNRKVSYTTYYSEPVRKYIAYDVPIKSPARPKGRGWTDFTEDRVIQGVRKQRQETYEGTGRLASVSYAGGRSYDRRPHIYLYENPLQSDIQLLSYYINKFRQEKSYTSESSKADHKKIEIEEKPEITEVTDTEPASE